MSAPRAILYDVPPLTFAQKRIIELALDAYRAEAEAPFEPTWLEEAFAKIKGASRRPVSE